MSEFPSGREFCSDPSTAQLFYREPINGVLSPWIPLPQSDYHSPRHEIHNALTGVSDGLGPISIRSTPATMSHVHGGYEALPPPSTQPYPTSQSSSLDGGQLFTQPTPVIHGRDSTTAPILQNPTQTKRTSRHARRSARAYDPLHGQQTRRSSGGGRGRTCGAANYKIREIEVLLDLVEEELPIASMGWRVVGSRFRDWASVTQQPARTDRSLELKFKQLIKTRKPTGDGVCPPHINRAHEIDHKLQTKVACRDFGDGEIIEIDDNDDDVLDDEMSDLPEDVDIDGPTDNKPTPRVRTVRVEPSLPSQGSARQSSSRGTDLLDKISRTLDPDVQSRREADRASSMFQTQQLILLQSQIRDLNGTIHSLRSQLDDSERHRADADRRADRLQNQIDIDSAVSRARLYRSATRVPRYATPISVSSTSETTPERNRRYEATFRDGGRCSWFGNPDRYNEDNDVLEVMRIPWSPATSREV